MDKKTMRAIEGYLRIIWLKAEEMAYDQNITRGAIFYNSNLIMDVVEDIQIKLTEEKVNGRRNKNRKDSRDN